MRVTNLMVTQDTAATLRFLKERVASLQQAIASGQVLRRPSDDPVAATAALALASAGRQAAEYERAAGAARDWYDAADGALANLSDALGQARETAVAAGTALDATGREALAQSVEHALTSARAAAAGRYRGGYLFSGARLDRSPFAFDPASGAAAYQGDDTIAGATVAPGVVMPLGLPGRQLLAGGDFFATLQRLAADIRAGDNAAVNDRLGELDRALDQVMYLRSTIGARQEQSERYVEDARQAQAKLQEHLALTAGVDLEKAVLELQDNQNTYQAALAVTARVLPQSLMDYLR